MHMYDELREMLCKELEDIVHKGELSAGSLDVVDKITHSIKSIDAIMAMDDYSGDDGAGNRSRDGDMSTRRRYSRRSYARRRDAMGRYTNRNYSYDDAKEDMVRDLNEVMNETNDESLKAEMRKFINKVENMQ